MFFLLFMRLPHFFSHWTVPLGGGGLALCCRSGLPIPVNHWLLVMALGLAVIAFYACPWARLSSGSDEGSSRQQKNGLGGRKV